MFRFGVLSTARIGEQHVAPAIACADNCVVSAVASRNAKRAERYADRFGIPHAFDSYEAMLASDVIDGVYIPLPTSQHVDWAIAAAKAGKHVLVEKPLALKARDIAAVIRARDAAGVVVSEAFMVTYHPQWAKVRELLAKGSIGRLRMVQGSFAYHNTDPNNMRNRPELGGGVIPDIGVYPTVATRFATGSEPTRVQASIDWDPDFGTDCFASVRAEFDGFELAFYLSTQLAGRQSMVFHGDKGFIELSAPFNSNIYEGSELRVHDRGHGKVQTFNYVGVNQYQLQAEAFARVASGKKGEVFSLEDSVNNQRVIDAIYKAGKSGRWAAV